MNNFLKENGKTIKQLYVNQVMMSIFGLMVITACYENNILIILASILAIGLYMFLTYHFSWRAGAKRAAKRMKVDNSGSIKTGFFIMLSAGIFNIVTMTAYAVIKLIVIIEDKADSVAAFAGSIVWSVIRFTNAVYIGFETLFFPNPNAGLPVEEAVIEAAPLLTPPYFFFLTLIPAFIVGILAYYLGASEISILQKLGFKPNFKTDSEINYKVNKK